MFSLQNQCTVCPLPWTQNAPKSRPMDSSDRTAHDLCRPIRSLQDVTSLRRSRNHLLWLTMGQAPSTLQSSLTQQILAQLQAYWAQTTANYVPFTLMSLRLLYTECFQGRTPFLILRWVAQVCNCAKSFASVLKRPRPISYCAHPVKPFHGREVHLEPYNGT